MKIQESKSLNVSEVVKVDKVSIKNKNNANEIRRNAIYFIRIQSELRKLENEQKKSNDEEILSKSDMSQVINKIKNNESVTTQECMYFLLQDSQNHRDIFLKKFQDTIENSRNNLEKIFLKKENNLFNFVFNESYKENFQSIKDLSLMMNDISYLVNFTGCDIFNRSIQYNQDINRLIKNQLKNITQSKEFILLKEFSNIKNIDPNFGSIFHTELIELEMNDLQQFNNENQNDLRIEKINLCKMNMIQNLKKMLFNFDNIDKEKEQNKSMFFCSSESADLDYSNNQHENYTVRFHPSLFDQNHIIEFNENIDEILTVNLKFNNQEFFGKLYDFLLQTMKTKSSKIKEYQLLEVKSNIDSFLKSLEPDEIINEFQIFNITVSVQLDEWTNEQVHINITFDDIDQILTQLKQYELEQINQGSNQINFKGIRDMIDDFINHKHQQKNEMIIEMYDLQEPMIEQLLLKNPYKQLDHISRYEVDKINHQFKNLIKCKIIHNKNTEITKLSIIYKKFINTNELLRNYKILSEMKPLGQFKMFKYRQIICESKILKVDQYNFEILESQQCIFKITLFTQSETMLFYATENNGIQSIDLENLTRVPEFEISNARDMNLNNIIALKQLKNRLIFATRSYVYVMSINISQIEFQKQMQIDKINCIQTSHDNQDIDINNFKIFNQSLPVSEYQLQIGTQRELFVLNFHTFSPVSHRYNKIKDILAIELSQRRSIIIFVSRQTGIQVFDTDKDVLKHKFEQTHIELLTCLYDSQNNQLYVSSKSFGTEKFNLAVKEEEIENAPEIKSKFPFRNIIHMDLDELNKRIIFNKPNLFNEIDLESNVDLQIFQESHIQDFSQIITDYKLKQIVVSTFLDGMIIIDMNNGNKIDKLSKDQKGIIQTTHDHLSQFVATTQQLWEINKRNGHDRKILKNAHVKYIYLTNEQVQAATTKGIVEINRENPLEFKKQKTPELYCARQIVKNQEGFFQLLTDASFLKIDLKDNNIFQKIIIKEATKFYTIKIDEKEQIFVNTHLGLKTFLDGKQIDSLCLTLVVNILNIHQEVEKNRVQIVQTKGIMVYDFQKEEVVTMPSILQRLTIVNSAFNQASGNITIIHKLGMIIVGPQGVIQIFDVPLDQAFIDKNVFYQLQEHKFEKMVLRSQYYERII